MLPGVLDRTAEHWSRTGPRARLLAGVVAAVTVMAVAGYGATRSPWGPPTEVVVAARDLAAGTTLSDDDVHVASWPSALLRGGSFGAPGDVVGLTVVAPVTDGMPLAPAAVSDGGWSSMIPAGHVAYPLDLEDPPTVSPGQFVDVVGGDGQTGAHRLTSAATVLGTDGHRVWLEVPREDAPSIAAAATWGHVTLVLLGG